MLAIALGNLAFFSNIGVTPTSLARRRRTRGESTLFGRYLVHPQRYTIGLAPFARHIGAVAAMGFEDLLPPYENCVSITKEHRPPSPPS